MSKVFFGLERFGFEGVDQNYVDFILQFVVAILKEKSPHRGSSIPLSFHPSRAEVGLMIVSDKTIRLLNARYRNQDKPVGVLSFAYGEGENNFVNPEEDRNYLGDIYISHDQVMAGAHRNLLSPQHEFSRLFVHGILHLMGFDHITKRKAAVMEKLEEDILREILV